MRCSGPFEETRKCGIGRTRVESPPPCHGVFVFVFLLFWLALFTTVEPIVASPIWRFSLRGVEECWHPRIWPRKGRSCSLFDINGGRDQKTRYGIQPGGLRDCQVSTRFRERASTRKAGSEYHVFALGHMRYGNGVVVATLITWDSAEEGKGVLCRFSGGGGEGVVGEFVLHTNNKTGSQTRRAGPVACTVRCDKAAFLVLCIVVMVVLRRRPVLEEGGMYWQLRTHVMVPLLLWTFTLAALLPPLPSRRADQIRV